MKSLKRVLWISDYFPKPHDLTTGVWALETAVAINKRGVEVVVLSPTPWIPRGFAFTRNLREWSNVPPRFKVKNLPVFYPKCPYYPHLLIRKYFYSFVPFFDSSLVWYWCKDTIARIVDRYPFQVVHSNFIFPSGYVGLEIKNKYGIPLIVHERSLSRLTMAKNHLFSRKIYNKVVENADAVITLNHKMANLIKEIASDKEVTVIRAMGDTEIADTLITQKPEKYKGKKVILSVGTLTERKAHEYLIKAVNYIRDDVPDIKCIIIGRRREGEYVRRLEKLINKLGLNDIIELYGLRPHNEVLKTMSWCDVFALPSWNEPFGTVYSEAMTFKKPIIACEGEGISEVLEDGVHGLLVKKQDVESLAKALKKVLNDNDLASRLGGAARLLVERELDYNSNAGKIIDLYKQLIN